jgi:hypothetical protein
MAITANDLREIRERNQRRQERKLKTTPGDWLYDSFAFIDAGSDPSKLLARNKQMCVIVRPRTWLDSAWDRYGHHFLDEGIDPKDMSPYYDADWIVEAHNDSVERDVDTLLAEIRRLTATTA